MEISTAYTYKSNLQLDGLQFDGELLVLGVRLQGFLFQHVHLRRPEHNTNVILLTKLSYRQSV